VLEFDCAASPAKSTCLLVRFLENIIIDFLLPSSSASAPLSQSPTRQNLRLVRKSS